MTPDQLTAISMFVSLFSHMGGWQFGSVLFCIVIGPWVAAFILVWLQGQRFERVVKMYENNIFLVEDYAKLAIDLHDIVIMNTQTMTELVESIKNQRHN